MVGMPSALNQALQTPTIQNDAIQTAISRYETQLMPYFNTPIGTDIAPTNASKGIYDWINWLIGRGPADTNYANDMVFICNHINAAKKIYTDINTALQNYNRTDITTQNNYYLQNQLNKLTEERNELQQDAEVAELRDTTLRSGNGAVSNHQVYLLGRPLRPATIPYLWALSVLFIGIAILIFYMFYPYTMPPLDIILFDLYLLFSSPWIWSALFAMASVVILFLSLRITNII
jgi:hypothetical protein